MSHIPFIQDGTPTEADLLRNYATVYEDLKRQLATPPLGWFNFGHHVDEPDVSLEFWGEEGGVPIWERPVEYEYGVTRPSQLSSPAYSMRDLAACKRFVENPPLGMLRPRELNVILRRRVEKPGPWEVTDE